MTFQLSSAMFGGSADKYLSISANNGMRYILSCENHLGAFVINGLRYVSMGSDEVTTSGNNSVESVTIVMLLFTKIR